MHYTHDHYYYKHYYHYYWLKCEGAAHTHPPIELKNPATTSGQEPPVRGLPVAAAARAASSSYLALDAAQDAPSTAPTQWKDLMDKAEAAMDAFDKANTNDNEDDPEALFPTVVEAYDAAIEADPSQWELFANLADLFATRRDENGEIT